MDRIRIGGGKDLDERIKSQTSGQTGAKTSDTDEAEPTTVITPSRIETVKKRFFGEIRAVRDALARKTAVHKLRESEEKFRSFFEVVKDPSFILDVDGLILEANREACERLGYSREEFLKMNIREVDASEQAALIPGRFETLRRQGHHLFEAIHRARDGTRVPVEISARLFESSGNRLIFVICRDIMERKRAESALKESERRFSAFMAHLPASAFIKDGSGRILYANRYLEQLLGQQCIIGKTTEEMVPSEIAERMRADDLKVLTEGPLLVKERLTDPNGAEIFFDTYKFAIEGHDVPAMVAGIAFDTTERVRVERELAETKILLQSAFNQTPVPMALVSAPEAVILYANDAGMEMLGIDGASLVGRSLDEISPTWQDFDSEGHPVPWNELPLILALQGVTTKNKEMIVKRKDGTRRYEMVSAAPIYNSEGEIIAAFLVFPDITDRKRMEDALEKRVLALTQPLDDVENIAFEDLFNLSELQRLQDLFAEVWGVGALITRPDGTPITRPSNFTYFCSEFIRKNEIGVRNCKISDATLGRHNPSGPTIRACLSAGLLGAGASITVAGRHIASWLIGQVRSEAQSEAQVMAYSRAIGADEAAFRDALLKVPIMPQKTFEQIAQSLFTLANQLSNTAYQNIQQARFIAERRKVEDKLSRSEQNLKEAQRIARIGNWELDLVSNKLEWSDSVYALFEIDPREFDATAEAFLNAIHPEDRDKVEQAYYGSLKDGSLYEIAHRLLMDDGRIKWVKEIGHTEYDPQGHPIKSCGIVQDITAEKRAEEERKRFETQMREVQKLESLGLLAGGIAHDFNNLLMAILGNADLAALKLSAVSPARNHIEEVIRASHRGADLCRQMLAYSGKGRFVVGRHDLSEIVREMGQMLDVSISKKALLSYALGEDLPAVEVDATQIRQVIMNLITNASEALGERKGVISITTGVMACDDAYLASSYMDDRLPAGDYVYLEISDSGCGMDAEAQKRIFDPFFTTKFTGRGLGLAAVLGIVRGHRGAIKVYSEVGRGTTFKILLPAVGRKPGDKEKPVEEGELLHGGGTILLVDDDPDIRDVASAMLEMLGFQVLTATNGRQGLEIFRTRGAEVVCVILDLMMPEMGGEEAFRELRRMRSDVHVILSSGYNEQDVAQRFIGRGLTGFIQKPYTMANLRNALRRALD